MKNFKMENKKEKEFTVYNFNLPTRLHTAFKQVTAKNRITMKEVLTSYIEKYITEE